jgi:hypothetical protein
VEKVILFIDFDGVTHPEPRLDSAPFCQLNLIEEVVRLYRPQDIPIVISSSWSELFSLASMRAFFQPDVASLVIDHTQIIGRHQFPPGQRPPFERQWEIETWLNENRPGMAWVAIDDREHLFEPQCANLLLTNSKTGFNAADADVLVRMIEARI